MKFRLSAALAAAWVLLAPGAYAYGNFRVAIYCRAQEVQKMADPKWLEESWRAVSREVHVDRIYLETHRDRIVVDAATLEAAKKFFAERGVQVAGGITYTISEPNRGGMFHVGTHTQSGTSFADASTVAGLSPYVLPSEMRNSIVEPSAPLTAS